MANIIKVRCNGPDKHVNDVDIDKLTTPTTVLKISGSDPPGQADEPDLPASYELECKFCTEGRVVVTREMIEENRGKD